MTLRRAGPADARAIAAVMRAAVRGVPPGAQAPAALAAWGRLPALYHRWAMGPGGERYVVALGADGRRVLGYAARRGGELTAVFVRPSDAGRGVGTALVEAVAREARRAGLQALRVLAAEDAVAFYRRLGFRGARRVDVALPGGASLRARALARALSTGGAGRRGGPRRTRARTARTGGARSSR